MNLKQIRYFCEVVKVGSAAQAAKILHVAPTAISMQISQLENELGGQVFDRTTRPMELTELGKFFYPRATDILANTNQLEREAKKIVAGQHGWLGLGFVRSALFSFMPSAIRAFRKEYPEVQLDLVEELSDYQPDSIRNGKFHVGISRFIGSPVVPEGFSYKEIMQDSFVAAVPVNHPLASRTSLSLSELCNEEFIAYPKDPLSVFSGQLLSLFWANDLVPQVAYEAVEINTAIALVSAGLGCTLVGESISSYQSHGVVFIPVDDLKIKSVVGAIFLADEKGVLVDKFLDCLSLDQE
ncbi:LysR family transcriptional regulator [Vibrio fluvialis]|nr:LysR family transcriptional regulator [Vibrio fluvialis]EKO3482346.1 LysR family transcriptional regulator [Vibrio fluvialis]ELO1772164.1 LysR family transcriptional regulator [Vibrio fluvialis]ELO4019150.1 LysR family transcriptional regulator [Vibrio fluvialis]ELV8552941.1 LysR family transcriptional regulator [Vibrio fluvialis]